MNDTRKVILWLNNQENLYHLTKWSTTIEMLEAVVTQAVKEHTILDAVDLSQVNWGEVWEAVKQD